MTRRDERGDQLWAEIRDVVQEWIGELRRAVKTLQSVREQGAHRVSFTVAAGLTHQTGQNPTHVANTLLGWSVRETTGAAIATVIFRDGHNSDGEEIAAVTLAAGESDRDAFPFGISLIDGLYLDVVSGAVAGAVYLGSS